MADPLKLLTQLLDTRKACRQLLGDEYDSTMEIFKPRLLKYCEAFKIEVIQFLPHLDREAKSKGMCLSTGDILRWTAATVELIESPNTPEVT